MSDYHKIRSLEVSDGFLKGVRIEFHKDLNCIIGGRGTGKTTVLEIIRFGLDRMPDADGRKGRFRALEQLLKNNLAGGTMSLDVETKDGVGYKVTRSIGEPPSVTTEGGEAVEIDISKDSVFGVDVYSQNQIEQIASDNSSQLKLIDKFVHERVGEIDRQKSETTAALSLNASKILKSRQAVDNLTESTRDLIEIEERIKGLDKRDGEGDNSLRLEHSKKSQRSLEQQLFSGIESLCKDNVAKLTGHIQELEREISGISEGEAEDGQRDSPNEELIAAARKLASAMTASVVERLTDARSILSSANAELGVIKSRLLERHQTQEREYLSLVEDQTREQARGAERAKLEKRRVELLSKKKKLESETRELFKLNEERKQLRAQLSNFLDERFALRVGVAKRLSEHLSPMIRVRIEQFGNTEKYHSLLMQSMRGSGLRYATIVDRIVERIPPADLVNFIQSEDRATLERELELDSDRATRLIIQLKDKPEIFAIETVELHDRPVLELKDGEDYKESTHLSTGQKCTTILPILLMESERPLLIDQPEDNLDNAFIYETIVQSLGEVRGRRQLIFVTHNPNIPVLGDASRVFCLRSTGREARLASSGTVDETAYEIMQILEGGREAFEARQKRYGNPVPS